MQQLHVSDLFDTRLPDRLPPDSRLKVWVRSTGYEVHFSQRKPANNYLFRLLVLALTLVGSVYAIEELAAYAPYQYLVLLIPAWISLRMALSFFSTRRARIRLDITPMTIAISYLDNANRAQAQEHVPLKQIESFYIDTRRGLALNSTISEIMYRTWIGSGLQPEDLHYLARLIAESSRLSMQRSHPGSV